MEGMTGQSPPLDTIINVSTPENVAFDFRLAGPFHRFVALFVDFVVLGACFFGLITIGIFLGFNGTGGQGLLLFVAFILWWGYAGLLETFCNGQTIGKKAVGIRVVSNSGLAINASQAILRNILRTVDLAPPFFPAVASMLLTSRFQRLGDLAAETMVVIDGGRIVPRPPVSHEGIGDIGQIVPAHFRPNGTLIDALAAFVGRRNDVSDARRRELAQPLANYYIRAWELPIQTDPDLILCMIYAHAIMDQTEYGLRSTTVNQSDVSLKPSKF